MEEMEALMEINSTTETAMYFTKGWTAKWWSSADGWRYRNQTDEAGCQDERCSQLKRTFCHILWKYGGKRVFRRCMSSSFSLICWNFYESLPATDEKELNEEIELLYKSEDFDTVRGIVDKNIDRLAGSFDKNPSMVHREIEIVKKHIYEHFGEDISVESLSKWYIWHQAI